MTRPRLDNYTLVYYLSGRSAVLPNYETVIAVNAGTHPFDPELETGGNSCSTR